MPEQSYYSRLIPDQFGGYPKEIMTGLADWMRDTEAHRGDRPRVIPGLIPSGYVYFAQFVNHDLSYDKTKLSAAGEIAPEATPNYRTACFDLETLYGKDATKDGYLKLGNTVGSEGEATSDNDLDRDATGQPNIPDMRNDSTLLLAQLHMLFTKFHNRLLDDVRSGRIASASDGDAYEQTKRLVTWHYQWLVHNDFLPKIAMPDVLDDITLHWPRLFRPKLGQATIPVEFSLAAFQYGHGAVNFIYNINQNLQECPQEETMYLTGAGAFQWPPGTGPAFTRLPEKYVVDPARMFGWAPRAKVNFSAILGTLITDGLSNVPGQQSLLLNNEPLVETGLTFSIARNSIPTFSLPESTFHRGAAVGLPSGQQACRAAGVEALAADQLAYDPALEEFLRTNGMLQRTPLFYYLMREAEVSGRLALGQQPGVCLGPLGSRIVAEVILGVLSADPNSYTRANWEPPDIPGDSDNATIRIDSLKKLMFYAAGYKSPGN